MQLPPQPKTGTKEKRRLPRSVQIDMTPLVDLGFLLITFFVFTSALSSDNHMSLSMPANGDPIEIPQSKTISFLLGKDHRVYAYKGIWHPGKLMHTGYDNNNGVRALIIEKQEELESTEKDASQQMIVLIKPMESSTYVDLVKTLDEMLINNVKKYAVVNPSKEEVDFINGSKQ